MLLSVEAALSRRTTGREPMLGKLALPSIRELIALRRRRHAPRGAQPLAARRLGRAGRCAVRPRASSRAATRPAQTGGRDLRLSRSRHPADRPDHLLGGRVAIRLERDGSGRPDGPAGRDCLRSRPSDSSTCSIQNERSIARALLEYREDSVGRLMTPDYLVVRREWTMRHVLDHIRAHGRDRETLERHLHHRRAQQAGRRPADSRDPAGPAARPCLGPDGQRVRESLRHRRPEEGRRGLRQVRPDRAAGRRHPGPDGRDRHPRRRARRRRARGHPRLAEIRRTGSARRALHEHARCRR